MIKKAVFVRALVLVFAFLSTFTSYAEDGYHLWLRYLPVEDDAQRNTYAQYCLHIYTSHDSPIITSAIREFETGLTKMLDITPVKTNESGTSSAILLIKTQSENIPSDEGFHIRSRPESNQITITSPGDKGLLYGTFHLLQILQQRKAIDQLDIIRIPKIRHRILNHWDNLDRTVERGYAGFSIWNWHELPDFISPQYIDYARANASIGINGAVVTNVNANALIFREDYLKKAAALADIFRPYGIRLYLTARFSSPIELGGLTTADPLHPEVREWWNQKVDEIYRYIPDFGGFVVKANSEGQPGPQDYGRSHVDGANMLAKALQPHGGLVMWRAFVYSNEEPEDRAKQAYSEFVPLDGSFQSNVMVQVKNGPIDFQPREPIHPLFGAMPNTPLMMEFQITKEYLGQGTHLVGLANMYEEILQTDTHIEGEGSTVARVIDGSLHGKQLTGMAGVANIGTARNWTGNLFGQADWFAFGKLAWDPDTKAEFIFKEWAALTFPQTDIVQKNVFEMLDRSYEICVNYMTPLGLHHIMAAGHHYGPGPWVSQMSRADWTSVYYHKADEEGLGFDRTVSGSNALSQYSPMLQETYSNPDNIPLEFLLWFHKMSWDKLLPTGRTLWEELCHRYHLGAEGAYTMKKLWMELEGQLDDERYNHVLMHLNIQQKEAKWWRDACLSYFQSFSGKPIPPHLEQPEHDLEYYKSLSHPYAPGIRPRW